MTPSEFIDDPRWADFLPEKPDAARSRALPAHEDCVGINSDSASDHLRRGGTLGSMEGYEERPGQIDMLRAIVRAFNGREHLMIEAGTGVGKSLAYLVPSILWANANDTPVVISTATRNLQSQLIASDIPRAIKVLGDGAGRFRVALLKGRANYLCLRAVGDFFASGYWTMSAEEQAEMPHFIEWLHETQDGDLDRYDGLPRNLLTCPGEECGGRRCPFYTRCFVYRARKNAAEAHLVIANHALVLAEALNPGAGILPAHGRVVFDEAHNLEDIATEALSRTFSLPDLVRILNRLSRRQHSRFSRPGGILSAIDRQLQKGVLAGSAAADAIRGRLKTAPSHLVRVMNAAEALADCAERMLRPTASGVAAESIRYRMLGGRRQHSQHGLFEDYGDEVWSEEQFHSVQTRFENELAALVNLLHALRDTLEDSVPEGEFNFCADLATQVSGVAESLVDFANETNFVLRGTEDTHAYWIERVRPANRPSYIRLVAAPLSVADDLRKMVWDVRDSAILSSATLRVGNDFGYCARRLGFYEAGEGAGGVRAKPSDQSVRYRHLTATSPFDYLRQALVLAPDGLPDPAAGSAAYVRALAELLGRLFRVTRGRALVLFTSYEMMNAVAGAVRDDFAEAGLTLLVQGAGRSRESMTEELRSHDGVVLFGAQSFWEGVDVSGAALSCVVLARLPFAHRTDPIVEARSEQVERTIGNAFRNYYLPEAVITFRQGFGRLIRSKRDRGVVVVTDPRIVTKSYGAVFRQSIPASVHTVTDADELLSKVSDFLS